MSDSSKITVNYFCLGALLIFVGSVLLCALGFTIVLPFEATRSWPQVLCMVVNSSYDTSVCSCDEQLSVYDTCVSKYPCLQVYVSYIVTAAVSNETDAVRNSSTSPVNSRSSPASFDGAAVYRRPADGRGNSGDAERSREMRKLFRRETKSQFPVDSAAPAAAAANPFQSVSYPNAIPTSTVADIDERDTAHSSPAALAELKSEVGVESQRTVRQEVQSSTPADIASLTESSSNDNRSYRALFDLNQEVIKYTTASNSSWPITVQPTSYDFARLVGQKLASTSEVPMESSTVVGDSHNRPTDDFVRSLTSETTTSLKNEQISGSAEIVDGEEILRHAKLYRSWDDSFHPECSLTECGDDVWNIKESRRFRSEWGRIGQTFSCYFNPNRPEAAIIERTSTVSAIHAIFWPCLFLLTGIGLWFGLCCGCWSIRGAGDNYKDDYSGVGLR